MNKFYIITRYDKQLDEWETYDPTFNTQKVSDLVDSDHCHDFEIDVYTRVSSLRFEKTAQINGQDWDAE